MKTVKVKVRCMVCKKFEKIIDVDINEHGFFIFPDAYCPECLCIMEQDIDDRKTIKS